MTSTLVLRLSGPLQSWGDKSRYFERNTQPVPTKSGVLGILAAAEGRRRGEPLADLAGLYFVVRVDQPGILVKDYQTAQRWQTNPKAEASLVTRYYLSDAVFVAAIEAPDRFVIDGLTKCLRQPRFPLFLGRRSCPASPDLVLGVFDEDAISVLKDIDKVPWQACSAHRRERDKQVYLPIHRDARPGEHGRAQQDVPVSFSQEHRQYEWREVIHEPTAVTFANPDGKTSDPFFEAVASV